MPRRRGRRAALRWKSTADLSWRSAASLRSAKARIGEAWFIEELERMRSNGKPILRPRDACLVRPANSEEAAALDLERAMEQVRGEDVKYCFAFLIEINREPN